MSECNQLPLDMSQSTLRGNGSNSGRGNRTAIQVPFGPRAMPVGASNFADVAAPFTMPPLTSNTDSTNRTQNLGTTFTCKHNVVVAREATNRTHRGERHLSRPHEPEMVLMPYRRAATCYISIDVSHQHHSRQLQSHQTRWIYHGACGIRYGRDETNENSKLWMRAARQNTSTRGFGRAVSCKGSHCAPRIWHHDLSLPAAQPSPGFCPSFPHHTQISSSFLFPFFVREQQNEFRAKTFGRFLVVDTLPYKLQGRSHLAEHHTHPLFARVCLARRLSGINDFLRSRCKLQKHIHYLL